MKTEKNHHIKTSLCVSILLVAFFMVTSCHKQSGKSLVNEPEKETLINRDREGKVMTVTGLIPADSMGITLPHEHLLIVHSKTERDLTDVATAISELQFYADAGGKTLVDASNIGIGRNPEGLKQISVATGINVIMGSGFYKDKWVPDSIKSKSIKQLADIIINDIINGINGIHAGVIGEIGLSWTMTKFEKKVLKAAARAQKATGAAINLHFDIPGDIKDRYYAMFILKMAGADLTRVYISHNVPYLDMVNTYVTYAKIGCYVAFDLFGLYEPLASKFDQDKFEPVETIKALVDRGYINKILISQDICIQECYIKNGGSGYAHILNDIVPELKAAGLTDEEIYTIMVENPKRLLPFKIYAD